MGFRGINSREDAGSRGWSQNRPAKRDRDKIDRLGGEIRRVQSSGCVFANVVNAVSSRPSRHGKADGRMSHCYKR